MIDRYVLIKGGKLLIYPTESTVIPRMKTSSFVAHTGSSPQDTNC